MLLIDELVEYSPTRALVRARVRPGGAFVVAGHVPATILLEYMAQAIAAAEGMHARNTPPSPGRRRGERSPGLLLGTRELELGTQTLAVGDTLEIHVVQSFSDPDSGLACYDCEVQRDGQRVAAALVNVMLAPDLGAR
ncbi:3-hydroxydecanoyl-[ACP] dehydratase [Enhygromyxa salina]|uniref:3-hydroxydecanoyl-[ACP] dehydratase n=2 Tax=Enhygromyxa salina TaxID=215803 RepID=A0A0C2D734_9BACT|nr:3-hydroxydecanoyl-[ACP] dehydratase [Enhygromyxa salina]